MKQILLLLCIANWLQACMPSPKKLRLQEASWGILPADLKRKIIHNNLERGSTLNIPGLATEILTLSHINRDFRIHINNAVFVLSLLQSLPKACALVLANKLEKMPGMQNSAVQEWLRDTTRVVDMTNGCCQRLNEMVLAENLEYLCIAIIGSNKNLNVNWADDLGTTTLMKASHCGRTEVVRLLLCAGADVNAKRIGGTAALTNSSAEGHTEIARLLIAAGAKVDAQDDWGGTALTWAIKKGRTEVVDLLLAANTNVNIANKKGHTARYYAQKYGRSEIIKRLDNVGARGSYYWHWCPFL